MDTYMIGKEDDLFSEIPPFQIMIQKFYIYACIYPPWCMLYIYVNCLSFCCFCMVLILLHGEGPYSQKLHRSVSHSQVSASHVQHVKFSRARSSSMYHVTASYQLVQLNEYIQISLEYNYYSMQIYVISACYMIWCSCILVITDSKIHIYKSIGYIWNRSYQSFLLMYHKLLIR